MRRFEKISYNQFKKDISDSEELYNEYLLPSRETLFAAGYDFYSLTDFILKPGEIKKIPTGIKVIMEKDDCLLLVVRSGMGFKNNIRMCNQVAVIDKDYYNNPSNEGHMFFKLQNEGNEDWIVKKGDGIGQGIFIKYLTVDNENENFINRESDY